MRLRYVTDAIALESSRLAASHAERLEQLAGNQCFEWNARGCGRNLARNDIHQVIVSITRAEALLRLEMRERRENVGACEEIGLRPEHQVARSFAKPAVVNQQIAH